MEVGSIAEWFEGGAEILAVSVALFLPYIQERRQNKARNLRAKQVIVSATKHLLAAEHIKDGDTLTDLETFIRIYSMLATNEKTVVIISIGSKVIDTIDDSEQLNQKQRTDIQALLAQLQMAKI